MKKFTQKKKITGFNAGLIKNGFLKICLILLLILSATRIYSQSEPPVYDSIAIGNTIFHCGFDPTEMLAYSLLHANDTMPGSNYRGPSDAIMTCGRFRVLFQDCIAHSGVGNGIGFDDGTNGFNRRTVVCQVLTYIQSVIDFSVFDTNYINILFDSTKLLPLGIVAVGEPFVDGGLSNTFYSGRLLESYLTGNLIPSNQFYGHVKVNFNGFASDSITPIVFDNGCNSIDFYSVILHEMTHVLGFFSYIDINTTTGQPISGYSPTLNVFSQFDKYFLCYDNSNLSNLTTTTSLQKLVMDSSGFPIPINTSITHLLFNGNIWLNGNIPIQIGNEAIYSGFHRSSYQWANRFIAGKHLSHLDGINYGYYDRGHSGLGFMPNYVMYPFITYNNYNQEYTKQELNILHTIGYIFDTTFLLANTLNPNGLVTNQTVLNNHCPRTTRATIPDINDFNYLFYPDFGFMTGISAGNIADTTIGNNQTFTVHLNAMNGANNSIGLFDDDNDYLSIYGFGTDSTSLFNIRGCGLDTNNYNDHGCLTVNSVAGNVITFTPRSNFFGRAQFGLNLYDGKEKGAFVVFTIDVTSAVPITTTNMVLNPKMEYGSEVKTTNKLFIQNTQLYNYKWGQYYYGLPLSDGHYYSQFDNNYIENMNPDNAGSVRVRYVGGEIIKCSYYNCSSTAGCGCGPQTNNFIEWGNIENCDSNQNLPNNTMNSLRYSVGEGDPKYPVHYALNKSAEHCHRYRLTFDAALDTGETHTSAFMGVSFDNDVDNTTMDEYIALEDTVFGLTNNFQTYTYEFNYCDSLPRPYLVLELGVTKGFNWGSNQPPLILVPGAIFVDNLILEDITNQTPIVNVTLPQGPFAYCDNNPHQIQLIPEANNYKCDNTFSWAPTTGLLNPNAWAPYAMPSQTTTYTITIGDGCNTASADVTVTVYHTPTAGNDTTICAGQIITLTATGGESYLWSTNDTTSSINVNPSDTTIYYVTVTGVNACSGTAQVTVNVNASPNISAGSNIALCAGDSTLLWANGSNTYLWSPPSGLSNVNIPNPVAKPDTTTIYTVIGTDNNHCQNTAQVTIIVNPLPMVEADSNVLICLGQSIQLHASGGINYFWNPSYNMTDSIIANPYVHPVVPTIYAVTVTDSNGCVGMDSVFVDVIYDTSCYCHGAIINDTVWNNTFHLNQNARYELNHDVTVVNGTNLILNDVSIVMKAPASIFIDQGASLTLNHCHLYGCDLIWNGIVVHSGGSLIISNSLALKSTLIEDAKTAIACSNVSPSTFLFVDNCIFNKNGTGIVIGNCQNTLNTVYPNFKITNSIFTSRAINNYNFNFPYWPNVPALEYLINTGHLTQHYDLGYPTTLLVNSTPANTGIILDNIGTLNGSTYYEGLIDGDNGNNTINLFDNLFCGLEANNSNFTCRNLTFQNINGNASSTTGLGIMANCNNSDLNRLRVIGGNNYFFDNKTGIYAGSYDQVIIDSVDIRSTQSNALKGKFGIAIQTPHSSKLNIGQNILSNIQYGIFFVGSNNTAQDIHGLCKIKQNTIQTDLAGYGGFRTETGVNENVVLGIAALTIFNDTTLHACTTLNSCTMIQIDSNNIFDVWNGIYTNNWQYIYSHTGRYCKGNRPVVMNNFVSLIDDSIFAFPYQYGIFSFQNGNAIVYNNVVENKTVQDSSYGIINADNIVSPYLPNSLISGQLIMCNIVDTLTSGIYFKGNQYWTGFYNNEMKSCHRGFENDAAILGQQGDSTASFPWGCNDKWTGTYSSGTDYMTFTEGGANPAQSWLFIEHTDIPSPNYNGNFGASNYSLGYGLTDITINNNVYVCPTYPEINYPVKNDEIRWLETLVKDSIDYTIFPKQQHINNLFLAYKLLDNERMLLDSSKISQEFYIENRKGNIGAIVNTEKAIAAGDFQTAIRLINNLIPQNNIERNYRKLFTVFGHYLANQFTAADSTILDKLVNGCSLRDGFAVDKAKTLHDMIYIDFRYRPQDCSDTNIVINNNIIYGILNESVECGEGPIAYDTLIIVDEKNNFVPLVSPVITDEDGNFSFDAEELLLLDTTALYKIASKSGFELEMGSPMTIKDWLSNSPISLSTTKVHQQWLATYIGPDSINDIATALDLAQSLYVVGKSTDSTNETFALIKYDSTGVQKWVTRFDTLPENNRLRMTAITIDSASNIYIAGIVDVQEVSALILFKIDSSGLIQWYTYYANYYGIGDHAKITGLFLDSVGNIIVGQNNYNLPGFILAKFDNDGVLLWGLDNDVLEYPDMALYSMTVDHYGNIYLSGKISDDWDNDGSFLTLRINGNGNISWTSMFPDSLSLYNIAATSNVVDKAGNIYVHGIVNGYEGIIITIKYQPGVSHYPEWYKLDTAILINYDGFNINSPSKLLIDDDANIYIYGTGNENGNNSFFIIKYDSIGNKKFTSDHLAYNDDNLNCINSALIAADGYIYITGATGKTDSVNTFNHCLTTKVDTSGVIQWVASFDPLGEENRGGGNCLKVSRNGNVYVTGGSTWSNNYNGMEYITIKYAQCPSTANLRSHTTTSKPDNTAIVNDHIRAYPNPTANEFTIEYVGDVNGQLLKSEVYNIYGALVKEAQIVNNNKLVVNTRDLPNGIYYYKVMLGNNSVGNNRIMVIK